MRNLFALLVLLIPSVLFAQEKGLSIGKMENKRKDRVYVGPVIKADVLAYCLCEKCCGNDAAAAAGKTATGKDGKVLDGVCADPKLLPYGTRLFIPGIGEKVVDDMGSRAQEAAKEGRYRIAIRLKDHKAVEAFHKRNHIHKDTRQAMILIIKQTIEK